MRSSISVVKRLVVIFPFVVAPGYLMAQQDLTIYGVVDSGFKYQQIKINNSRFNGKSTRFGISDGYYKSSRWGIRGTEELGNGIRVVFLLESKFKTHDGSSKRGFNGKSFVGISSDRWGAFTFGRQKSASKEFHSINAVKGIGKAKRAFGGNGITGNGLIKYVSPIFKGVQAGASYSVQGTKTRSENYIRNTDTEYYLSLAMKYRTGPVNVTASYDRERNLDGNKHAKSYTVDNWMLSGTYNFDFIMLALAYGQDRNGKLNSAGGIKTAAGQKPSISGNEIIGYYNNKGFKSYNTYIGISAPAGKGKVGVAWSRSSSNLKRVFNNNTSKNLNTETQHIYAAQYSYPISKRTIAYVHGSYATGMAYIKGLTSKVAGLGINHRF